MTNPHTANGSASTPAALGFAMPAEWEKHEATWLAWPHNPTDWPDKLDTIRWVYGEMTRKIMPGEKVIITISYVETLKFEDGSYEFVFPMVVGPRYIPGRPTGRQGGGWSPDTDRVPDASRQEHPDTSAYQDPEIVWRLVQDHHAGLILKSPSAVRIRELLSAYEKRFTEDFYAYEPPRDKPAH